MAKIAITGTTGFIGGHLSRHLLQHGHEVAAIQLRDTAWRDSVPFDTDTIIHLAGIAHDLSSRIAESDYYFVNTQLTEDLFDYFCDSLASRFIFMSSVKAVTDTPSDTIVTENWPPQPKTVYGKSKLTAELHINRCPPLPGKRRYILRPCVIHGPGNKGNLDLLYRAVASGLPYPLAAFDNSRSFLSIANLCEVIAEICENDVPEGTYNVADTEPLATRDVVSLIHEVLGTNPRLWRVPPRIVRFVASACDTVPYTLPFGKATLAKLTESYVVSNEKLRKAIGRNLTHSSLEGLTNTFESLGRQ